MQKFFNNQRSFEKLKSDVIDERNRKYIHGKEIWNILHTFSVYLSDNASEKEIEGYKDFVYGILYFGTKNDKGWKDNFERFDSLCPLKNISNRNDAIIWNCKLHNFVNLKIGKDLFECKVENIADRWGNYNKIKESLNNSEITKIL